MVRLKEMRPIVASWCSVTTTSMATTEGIAWAFEDPNLIEIFYQFKLFITNSVFFLF